MTTSELATWSTSRLAEQTIAVPVDESDVGAVTSEVQAGAGGVLLLGSSTPANFAAALQTLLAKAPGRIAPFVMVDEEGGAVQRMANLVGSIPAARTMGATMSPGQIENLAKTVGAKLRANGVTMDLAPVLDVDGGAGPNSTDADGTRSFSVNPTIAARDGVAFAKGLQAAGVVPVVKHFPGLGRASGNTDLEPASTVPWRVEEKTGLISFEQAIAAHLPAVMVSNASVPGLSALPSSVSSSVITGILRNQLGFSGLVLTDSLSVNSLSKNGFSVQHASVAAIEAGADMVLFNATAASEANVTASIAQSIENSVSNGSLPRARLVNAVTHVLGEKSNGLCS